MLTLALLAQLSALHAMSTAALPEEPKTATADDVKGLTLPFKMYDVWDKKGIETINVYNFRIVEATGSAVLEYTYTGNSQRQTASADMFYVTKEAAEAAHALNLACFEKKQAQRELRKLLDAHLTELLGAAEQWVAALPLTQSE